MKESVTIAGLMSIPFMSSSHWWPIIMAWKRISSLT